MRRTRASSHCQWVAGLPGTGLADSWGPSRVSTPSPGSPPHLIFPGRVALPAPLRSGGRLTQHISCLAGPGGRRLGMRRGRRGLRARQSPRGPATLPKAGTVQPERGRWVSV